MPWSSQVGSTRYHFPDLKSLLAKARTGSPAFRHAANPDERKAARQCLAEVPMRQLLQEPVIPYEADEITRLILDRHDAAAFAPVAGFSVGQFRDWLMDDAVGPAELAALAPGLTPEMVVAVGKVMANQDLVLVASKTRVPTRFRNSQGLPGRMSTRLLPGQPTDDPRQIAASVLDGLAHGCGDAFIGVKPASPRGQGIELLLHLLDEVISRYGIPTQSCVLVPASVLLKAIRHGVPVDLVFQSISGSEEVNRAEGINLALLAEARQTALATKRCPPGGQVMYFQTGHAVAELAAAHPDVDPQTLEARAFAVARAFDPLLVSPLVGTTSPGAPRDSRQMVRAGLENHFCGKLLGLPMGCDVCFEQDGLDQDNMDTLLTMLGVAGCHSIMGVPGTAVAPPDHPSASFQDSHFLRKALGLRPAPEFEDWLLEMGIFDDINRLAPPGRATSLLNSPWLAQLAAARAV